MGNRRILLYSNGLDSFLYWKLLNIPTCVYYKMNTPYSNIELAGIVALQQQYPDIFFVETNTLLDVACKQQNTSGFIPLRNTIMLFDAVLRYRPQVIYIGQVLEWQVDKNISYYKKMERFIFEQTGISIRILAPFATYTKTALVKRYLDLGGSISALQQTHSCLRGRVPCGMCSSCFNRYIALRNAGLDPGYSVDLKDIQQYWKQNTHSFRMKHIFMYMRRYLDVYSCFRG
jgi:7-cyano-7-deazaguanine synthase